MVRRREVSHDISVHMYQNSDHEKEVSQFDLSGHTVQCIDGKWVLTINTLAV